MHKGHQIRVSFRTHARFETTGRYSLHFV